MGRQKERLMKSRTWAKVRNGHLLTSGQWWGAENALENYVYRTGDQANKFGFTTRQGLVCNARARHSRRSREGLGVGRPLR